ncbi:MAG: hypothetical protein FIA92_17680 [Chloroflexi bacterium]|nr:hypothetical protein [Chloroflexota bacterium]
MRIRNAVSAAGDVWDDEPGDLLVGQLTQLAAIDRRRYGLGTGVARRGPIVLAVFRESHANRKPQTSGGLFGRRVAFAAAAAVLLLALGAGTLMASGPGRPLYGLRLAAEVALLPSDDAERLDAQMGRLDARLDEAAAARDANDPAAMNDALRAYSAILDEVQARPAPEEPYRSRAVARLTQQLARIEAIGGGSQAGRDAAVSARAMVVRLVQGDNGGGWPEPSQSQPPGGTETPFATPRPQPSPGSSPDPSPRASGGSSGPDGSGGPQASVEPGPSNGQGGQGGESEGGGEGGGEGGEVGDSGAGTGSGAGAESAGR